MSENLGFGWANNNCCCEERSNFGVGCNGSFFETLIMLIIIIWLLRWLFNCGMPEATETPSSLTWMFPGI